MSKFLVQKSGPLRGEVTISGSKNAVLPIMAATLLTEEKCVIHDAPALRDVDVMCQLLESLGCQINRNMEDSSVEVTSGTEVADEAPYNLVKMMRASILVLGALIHRTGHAVIPLPGGCAIGKRPVELHLKGLKAMGVKVDEDKLSRGIVDATAEKLRGNTIYLDFPSVGATEVIMMAATLAEGTTILENAAQEPEIVDLASFLNKMGARIKGAGTDTVKIEGVERLKGVSHHVIPDRIEAGTFMVGAAITKGDVLIKNVVPSHLKAVIAKLGECGVQITMTDDGMRVRGDVNPIISTDIKTLPYPGFPTDMQSPFMALLTVAKGPSVVIETVFENRFMHVGEFNRQGANIKTDGSAAIIPGDKQLEGAQVVATDLRAGAAVVLTGLVADGMTEVSQIYHIDRGYENFVDKLRGLGANIMRVED
ncbi:MAG: UDP-N-acetylglucosamine 1-carboxyvinyltransferase [Eubacterium sp.]|nr:UDP-N-acetylglucosamine 1-carboxyvinyltransferase [Candidatus Colimonas fimequi]